MRRLLWLALLLAFLPKSAHAACGTITAGMTQAQVHTALSTCVSGNTLTFPAGSYGPWSSTETLPCGVSLAGPVVSYSQSPNQAATLNGSTSFIGWAFQTTANCTANQSVQYLEWNGKQPTATCSSTGPANSSCGGGGFLRIVAGTNSSGSSTLTIQYNWFHGVNAPNADACKSANYTNQNYCATANSQADLIYFDGNSGSTVTQNVTVQWNYFGSTSVGDCGGTATYGAMNALETESNAGQCGGVGMHNNLVNVSILNNIFNYLEEPIKFFEGQGECNPVTVSNNWLENGRRIEYETQCNIGGSSQPTNMTIDYNVVGQRYISSSGSQQNYDISAANGCSANSYLDCVTHTDYNIEIETNSSAGNDVGLEIWGGCGSGKTSPDSTGTTASNNLIQGYLSNSITWSPNGCQYFTGNTMQNLIASSGTSTSCGSTSSHPTGIYWNWYNPGGSYTYPYTPSCPSNTFARTTSAQTSTAPTVSPAGGTVASGTVVSITNPGTGTNLYTSAWCTTNGDTPSPGGATSSIMTSYTVTSSVTLKCVGMWGMANQPTSYPANYGYVPSSTSSYAFTVGGTPQAATPTFSPASETFTTPFSVKISSTTPSATIYYTTNGTTPTNSSPIYSAPIAVSVTTTIQAIATASGYTQSAVGNSVYTYSPAVLASCYQSNSGSVNAITAGSTPIQQIGMCHYGGSIADTTCSPGSDAYGNSIINWGSSNTAILNVGAIGATAGCTSGTIGPGCAQGVTAGTANVTAIATGSITCSPWTFTVSNPTLTGVSISLQSGGSTVVIGSPAQACATMTYSGASPTTVCGSGSDIYGTTPTGWTSTSPSSATISSSGLVTGVLAGSTTIYVSAGAFTATPEAITVTNAVASPSSFMGGQLIGGQIQ